MLSSWCFLHGWEKVSMESSSSNAITTIYIYWKEIVHRLCSLKKRHTNRFNICTCWMIFALDSCVAVFVPIDVTAMCFMRQWLFFLKCNPSYWCKLWAWTTRIDFTAPIWKCVSCICSYNTIIFSRFSIAEHSSVGRAFDCSCEKYTETQYITEIKWPPVRFRLLGHFFVFLIMSSRESRAMGGAHIIIVCDIFDRNGKRPLARTRVS